MKHGTHGIPRLPGNNNYKVLEAGTKSRISAIDTNNVAINFATMAGACLQTGFAPAVVVKGMVNALHGDPQSGADGSL